MVTFKKDIHEINNASSKDTAQSEITDYLSVADNLMDEYADVFEDLQNKGTNLTQPSLLYLPTAEQ